MVKSGGKVWNFEISDMMVQFSTVIRVSNESNRDTSG